MAENTLRCAACGAENSFDNRFCGMCGRSLAAIPAPPETTRGTPHSPMADRPGPTRRETPVRSVQEGLGAAPTRYAAPEPTPEAATFPADEPSVPAPAYTGGLFRIREVEGDQPSRNLDYLLDDDEPKSHWGLFIGLTLIALLLAGGLGYLRFRNGGLAGILGSSKPATPAASTETGSTAESTKAPSATPSAPSVADAGTSAGSAPAAAPPATPAATVTAPPVADSKALTEVRPKNPAGPDAESAIAPAAPPKAEQPAPAPVAETQPAAAAKPAPPPKPAPKPVDPVALGEKYIYGRGVPQDCARGLKAVKPAADSGNVGAMITMGALYATGHCISMDLPTAYRFFALALRKDPDNAALKQNVEMVWSKMTQSERQQAIRLTQ